MKTHEVDQDNLIFIEVVPGTQKTEPILHTRPRNENIGRHRAEPWFLFGNWMVVSDEDLLEKYSKGISHDEGLPR